MLKLFNEGDQEIIEKALALFGKQSQINIAVGEIGEFLALIGKQEQGRASEQQWIDEIADIIITSHQMALLFGIEKVKERIEFKINRLSEKIKKYET